MTSIHALGDSQVVQSMPAGEATWRRGPFLLTALFATTGAAMIYLVPLAALWRLSWLDAVLFGFLGATQLSATGTVLIRPSRRRALLATAAAAAVVLWWGLVRLAGAWPDPNPWQPVNSVLGFAADVCAGLEILGMLLLTVAVVRGPRPRPSRLRRLLAGVAIVPLTVVIVIGVLIGVLGSSDGFPAGTVAPRSLPAGRVSTVEYCRPTGVPLAMDLHTPPASAHTPRPAPVVLYVHGGGWTMGGRGRVGVGATLAAQDGALFPGLLAKLTNRGFVVASIDYRLAPDAPWPASIQDAKCAVRFLRAHAADLGIDPTRIGAWGSSAGGQLVAMLGLAGPSAGFDVGQYRDQPSTVQAVVDMFGPTDLTDFADANPFASVIAYLGMGDNPDTLHSASPINYVTTAAPPFLILQGSDDKRILPRQSQHLADQLHAAGVPATLITVAGTGHTLNTPTEQPGPAQLTTTVADFFTTALH